MPDWLTLFATLVTVLGTAVTALATVFLYRVTRTLAVETRRMAEASAHPQVVATIEPNGWSFIHADLRVQNTGNATAFDIRVAFTPPLEKQSPDRPVPLQQVSVLKPGAGLSSYLSEFTPLLGKVFSVNVSWRRDPKIEARESITYTLNLQELEGLIRLGSGDPMIQIAEQLKKMREDWRYVATGFNKLGVNIFSAEDRLQEGEEVMRRFAQQEENNKQPEDAS